VAVSKRGIYTISNNVPLSISEKEEDKRITLSRRSRKTRPTTRGECIGGQRPCPWVSCRHHLLVDVKPNGTLILNHPGKDVDELEGSCALDVADRGGASLEKVGNLLGVVLERIRQLEAEAAISAFVAVKRLRQRPTDAAPALPTNAPTG
jgi:hypothetical protein